MISPSIHSKPLLLNLVAARGLAALMVAAFHCGQTRWAGGDLLQTAYDHQQFSGRWLNQLAIGLCNGHAAVNFFFVLSGFVLTYSSLSMQSPFKQWWTAFLTRRIFRIYPAVITTIAIFGLIYLSTGLALPGVGDTHFGIGELALNMLLIHTTIDGVMWTLRVEMLAIPLIMLCIWICHRHRERWLIPLALATMLLHFSSGWRETMGAQFAFVLGAIACVTTRKLLIESKTYHGIWGLVAFAAFLLPRSVLGSSSLWNAIIECAAAACLVSYLAVLERGIVVRLLHSQLLQRFGEASYSFYLLHPLCLLLFWRATSQVESLRALGIPSAVLVLVLTISSSWLIGTLAWWMWRWIEVPGARLGRNLCERKRSVPAADAIQLRTVKRAA